MRNNNTLKIRDSFNKVTYFLLKRQEAKFYESEFHVQGKNWEFFDAVIIWQAQLMLTFI